MIRTLPVFDSHGTLWFTVQGGNMVGRLDPKNGKIELKNVPTENALPYGIAINSKGVPFFCELGANKMAKIDPRPWTSRSLSFRKRLDRAGWRSRPMTRFISPISKAGISVG